MSGQVTTLGQISTTIRNGLFARRPTDDPTGTPILRISAVRDGRVSLSDLRYVQSLTQEDIERYALRESDLLITRYNGSRHLVGVSGLVPNHRRPLIHPDKLIRVQLDAAVADARFVNLQLSSPQVRHFLEPRIRTTAGQSGIAGGDVRAIPLWLPPIDVQRRVVEILEDHVSHLAAGVSTLSRVLREVDALALADLSTMLFSPDSWPRKPLADLLDLNIGGVWGDPPGSNEVDVRVLRVTELRHGGHLDATTAASRSIAHSQLKRRALRRGDLLLEKSGGGPTQPVGRIGIVSDLQGDSVCSNFMHLMRPAPEVSSRFLFWYLHAFYLRGGTSPMQKASTNIRNLKASEYLQMRVPVPPLDVQESIADALDGRASARSRTLGQLSALSDRERLLRRALLAAAFAGRLTSRQAPINWEAAHD